MESSQMNNVRECKRAAWEDTWRVVDIRMQLEDIRKDLDIMMKRKGE